VEKELEDYFPEKFLKNAKLNPPKHYLILVLNSKRESALKK